MNEEMNNAELQPKTTQAVSIDEIIAITQLPATLVDKFYASPSLGGLVRLTFAERTPDDKNSIPRFAIAMTFPRMVELNNLLNNIIQQVSLVQQGIQTIPQPQKAELN